MKNELYNRLERLANLLRNESRIEGQLLGLLPIQHEALYYLSICNHYSDSPLAVAEFLGLTKGTVSQSLKVLENRQLICKQKDPKDKRVVHLKLTEDGVDYLSRSAPPQNFLQATESLSKLQRETLNQLLQQMLSSYQKHNGRNGFGVCKGCIHNQSSAREFVCGLTSEKLPKRSIELICREYAE